VRLPVRWPRAPFPELFICEQIAHPRGFQLQGDLQVFSRRGEKILRDGLLRIGVVIAAHRRRSGRELVSAQTRTASKHHVFHRVRGAGKFRRTFVRADAVIDHRGDDGGERVGNDDDFQPVGEGGAQNVLILSISTKRRRTEQCCGEN